MSRETKQQKADRLEKERTEQAARHEAMLRPALAWTESVGGPDVEIPEHWNHLSTGFLFNTYNGGTVEVACSGPVNHARGRTDKTTTQGARKLYSTRLLALKALRNALEREYAEGLLSIDKQIEKEL
jgi:hypothetical protein